MENNKFFVPEYEDWHSYTPVFHNLQPAGHGGEGYVESLSAVEATPKPTTDVGSTQGPTTDVRSTPGTTGNVGSTSAQPTTDVGSTQGPTTDVRSTPGTTGNVGSTSAQPTNDMGSKQAKGKPKGRPRGSLNKNKTPKKRKTQKETAPDVEPFVTAAPVVTIQEVANEPSTFDEEREDEILTHSIESEDSMDESESTADKKFTRVEIETLLFWYRRYGRATLVGVRNNNEKAKAYMKMAAYVNGICKTHYTKEQVKNKLSNLKRTYKKALRRNNSSGKSPADFEYYEECAEAFEADRDVHPTTLVDSEAGGSAGGSGNISDASTIPFVNDRMTPRERRRAAQDNRERLEDVKQQEKREWRNDMLATLKELVAKI